MKLLNLLKNSELSQSALRLTNKYYNEVLQLNIKLQLFRKFIINIIQFVKLNFEKCLHRINCKSF